METLLKLMIWGYHYFWKHPYTVPVLKKPCPLKRQHIFKKKKCCERAAMALYGKWLLEIGIPTRSRWASSWLLLGRGWPHATLPQHRNRKSTLNLSRHLCLKKGHVQSNFRFANIIYMFRMTLNLWYMENRTLVYLRHWIEETCTDLELK